MCALVYLLLCVLCVLCFALAHALMCGSMYADRMGGYFDGAVFKYNCSVLACAGGVYVDV